MQQTRTILAIGLGNGWSLLPIAVGIAAIAAGIFGKNFYSESNDQKVPTWLRRLLFFGVGACFIEVGIKMIWDSN